MKKRTRKALCVGINYSRTNAALRGCVNDANAWAGLLTERGYEVTLLLDSDATKANILDALDEQIAAVGWLGRGVFTYSGHGTFVPDIDGDEVDGYDEALVPADYGTGALILDDELNRSMSRRRAGSRWVTLSDSCHSGTLSRDFAASSDPLRTDTPSARFLAPREVGVEAPGAPGSVVVPRGTPRSNGVLISGCRDEEQSYDAFIGNAYAGAMTSAALTALQSPRPPVTYGEWHKAIRATLPSARYPQTPQIQGTTAQQRWAIFD